MPSLRTKTLLLSFLMPLVLAPEAQAQTSHPVSLKVAGAQVLEDVQKAWSEAGVDIPSSAVGESRSKDYGRIVQHELGHLPETQMARAIYPARGASGGRAWLSLGTPAH
jgi:hypothetical protein